jgi:hypothetical protein
MTLFFGTAFVVAGLLSCLVPIALLICFATFFGRTARRMPPNATPNGQQAHEQPPAAPEPQFRNLPD